MTETKAKVYFIPFNKDSSIEELSDTAKSLIDTIVKEESIKLEKEVPLKAHFGEKGNVTFTNPELYDGIIEFLEDHNVKSSFIETNVVYKGERMIKEKHIALAKEHGFTSLPIIIADGERGEAYTEVEINKTHFKTCKIGKEFSKYKQMVVLAHFKGHRLAGFGGAIKQLAMGCASRGGKLAMHLDSKPFVIPIACKGCNSCIKECPVDAIDMKKKKAKINKDKCVGCSVCYAVCPHNAIQINMLKMLGSMFNKDPFTEKVAEYAYAASKGKKNIYMNFAINITPGCDCEGKAMEKIIDDIGIFASIDPVAIDKACLDFSKDAGKVFKGQHVLKHAEKIGLGTTDYDIIEV